jgi:hypothetical protein
VNVGTTTMENLLRVARSETEAGTAFAALFGDGSPSEIVSVPAAGAPESLSSEELAELARQAAADPEFSHARVFVRSVQMGQALTLAVAPLRDGVGHSMIGVVAGPDHRFEPAQLEVLERLAQRLLRHLQVVQKLSDRAELEEGPSERGAFQPEAPRSAGGSKEAPEAFGPGPAVPEAPRGGRFAAQWGGAAPPTPASGSGGTSLGTVSSTRAAPTGEVLEGSPDASPATWWAEPDPRTGLSSLGQFFSRAGRMLPSEDRTTGGLALVVVEVADPRTTPSAAQVLRAQLRFSDPLARVDCDLLAVAIVLFPSGTGVAVEQRLAAAVRSALERPDSVRTVHVVAKPGERWDVDELLREAVSRLPGRS